MKHQIRVQVLSLIDGELTEITANVESEHEQAAVDKLFALAKDERAYRFLGRSGVIIPSSPRRISVKSEHALGESWAIALNLFAGSRGSLRRPSPRRGPFFPDCPLLTLCPHKSKRYETQG